MAYRCLRRVRHNNKLYKPGDEVEMGAADAAPLVGLIALETVDPDPGEKEAGGFRAKVEAAIRALDWQGFQKDGKPATTAIAEKAGLQKVSAKVRDSVWDSLQKEGFVAPEKPVQENPTA